MTRYIFSGGRIRVEERMVPSLEPKKRHHALQSAVILMLHHPEQKTAHREGKGHAQNSQHNNTG